MAGFGPKARIAVVGSLNIDFTTTTPRMPEPGETLTATSLSISAGGKGANQAVACGRAASRQESDHGTSALVDISMVGAVGKADPYFDRLLKPALEGCGVDVSRIAELDSVQTGTASITVESNGENRIMVVPGANHEGMGDADEVWKRTMLNGRKPDVLVMQGEIPSATVFKLLEKARGEGVHIVFNPAPVFPQGITDTIFQGLDVLVVNESELQQLAEAFKRNTLKDFLREVLKEVLVKSHGEQLFHQLAELFHDHIDIRILVVTLGGKGVFYSQKGSRIGHVDAVKLQKLVDTTGAGDTFVGYLAVAFAESLATGGAKFNQAGTAFDLPSAVVKANAAAARCVQKAGAIDSIPWGWEVAGA